jgi:Protein of unknown function (DUF2961)/Collagen triple helix repeat (20 copies)
MRRILRLVCGVAMVVGLATGFAREAKAQTRTFVAYTGAFSADAAYSVNDMVSVGSDFYISLAPNNRSNYPATSSVQWAKVSAGSGNVGAQGPAGVMGVAGAMGIAGAMGVAGTMGSAGLQGISGPQGVAGPQGLTGVAGAPGAMGPVGLMGAMGEVGQAGPAGPAGSDGTSGSGTGANLSGAVRETRPLSVVAWKCINVFAGNSMTLFSATGPGNVERIQVAASYSSDASNAANALITIAVDGTTYTTTMGMFLLWNGYTVSDQIPGTKDLFVTKYLGVTGATSISNEIISGYRRIYIKYNKSISISLKVQPGPSVVWWTQVEYYAGVAPEGWYPSTRNVFHMAVNDWAAIAPQQALNIIPTVTGPGELESIYFVSSAPGKVEPEWLEANPVIFVDGTEFRYGGTEDFFGNQFYGDQFQARTDEYGIARDYQSGAPDNTTYWTAYRYFDLSPMVFNNTLGMAWQNAAADCGPAGKVGTLAVYYTEQ